MDPKVLIALCLMCLPLLSGGALAQDSRPANSDLVEGLSSSDEKIARAALREAALQQFNRSGLVRPLVVLAAGNQRSLAVPARDLLDQWRLQISSELIEIACTEKTALAVVALRRLSKSHDPVIGESILPLLDRDDDRITAEATRALFVIGGEKLDGAMRARLQKYSETKARQAHPNRYYNALYYAASRPLPEAYPHLVEGFDGPAGALKELADLMLNRHFRPRFYQHARQGLAESVGELRYRRLDFILKRPDRADRNLGMREIAKTETAKILAPIFRANHTWLEYARPQAVREWQGELSIRNEKSGQERSLTIRDAPEMDPEILVSAISLDLPLADLMLRPYRYAVELNRSTARQVLKVRHTGPQPMVGRIGIGNEIMGTWFGRERFFANEFTIRFDKALRPRETALKTRGGELRVRYQKWLRGQDENSAVPQVLVVESPRMMLSAVFTRRPEIPWVFNRARSALKQAGPQGGVELQPLATASYAITFRPRIEDAHTPK